MQHDAYPIGAYGVSVKNMQEVRRTGFNTAVVAFSEENLAACRDSGLSCALSVPRDPDRLVAALDALGGELEEERFSFYVNDEPGIHSFPESQAEEIYDILKGRYPQSPTMMAIVRPQVLPFYRNSAEYFMLDQYPVPNMPLTWLSDSMDEAAGYVGRDRLMSVIQAFGGGRFAASGWTRLPTFEEMNCLTFLSVVHGSRGIFFYSYPLITSTEDGSSALRRVVSRLNSMKSWLKEPNSAEPVSLNMTSHNRFDPAGNDAVHCVAKQLNDTGMLICVNAIRTYVEAEVMVPAETGEDWLDYFSDQMSRSSVGALRLRFLPLEVKVLLERKHQEPVRK